MGRPVGGVRAWIEARNAAVAQQPRCKPQRSLCGAQLRVPQYRLATAGHLANQLRATDNNNDQDR